VLSFTDVTDAAGTRGPAAPGETGGHGVSFCDVDQDGLPDLYITMIFDSPMADLFYRNLGGCRFAPEGEARGIADLDGGSHGAAFADLDQDGDHDLLNGATWTSEKHPALNNIFENDGAGRFTDVTARSGVPLDRTWPTRAVLTFDMDGDGDLDLFCVTGHQGSEDPAGERNEVYRNDGGLRFTPVEGGDLSRAPCGQGATDTDFDGDGDIDVIAANRTGDLAVLRNDGKGAFALVPPEVLGIRHRAGDGVTSADVDADGDLDLLLASDDAGFLYASEGGGAFAFQQAFEGTDGYMGGFADLDLDGDLDLAFAGDDVLYLNDGAGRFSSGPPLPAAGISDPRGIAFADIDLDGDLDFAVGAKRSGNLLVRNDLAGGNWLRVALVSSEGQAGAFGAKVRVHRAGSRALLGFREARSSQGYLGQDDPVLHFGLGEHETVDVAAVFLDGTEAVRERVAARQTITIAGSARRRTRPPRAGPTATPAPPPSPP
jgi:hypothetical protein